MNIALLVFNNLSVLISTNFAIAMGKFLEILLLILLVRFIIRFVIPMFQLTSRATSKMKEMQEQMNRMQEEQNQKHQQQTPKSKTKDGDYIEYEEVR